MVAIVQRLGLCFVEAKIRVRFPLATPKFTIIPTNKTVVLFRYEQKINYSDDKSYHPLYYHNFSQRFFYL